MSQPMSGAEMKAAYAAGRRDFRGVDLRGAELRGAKLEGVVLGPRQRWVVIRSLLGLAAGASFGFLFGWKILFKHLSFVTEKNLGPGAAYKYVVISFLFSLIRFQRGFVRAVAFAVAVAMVTLFTDGEVDASAFLVVIGAIAVSASFSLLNTGQYAFVFSLACVVKFEWLTGRTESVFFLALPVFISQFIAGWAVFHQALRGDPVHEQERNPPLLYAGLGSPSMEKADLTNADFGSAQLRGADLRGAVLCRSCFRGAKDLDWVRTDPGPLRSVPVLRLLMSGNGAKQSYANLNLSELDLSYCDLRGADLSGCDLRGTRLPPIGQLADAKLKGARIDAVTYTESTATPDDLAAWHERGVELIALEAFPLAAQERIAGEREGLTLYFSPRLGTLQRLLIDGVIVGVLGLDTTCHYEYTVDGLLAKVRLFDAPRADLERVAEALHRRVWEQAATETSTELALLRGFLGPVDLRAGLSDLVQRLERMTLRTPDPAAVPTITTALATTAPASAPAPASALTIDRWDWRKPTGPGGGQLQLAHPCRVLLLFDPKDRALADELHTHLRLLHDQGAVVLSRSDDLLPGDVIPAARAERLREADVLLVLASPDLLISEDCAAVLADALRPRQDPTARLLRVVPVPLRPCEWRTTALGQHQPLPDDGVPLAKAPDRDAAFESVASGLRRLALSRA